MKLARSSLQALLKSSGKDAVIYIGVVSAIYLLAVVYICVTYFKEVRKYNDSTAVAVRKWQCYFLNKETANTQSKLLFPSFFDSVFDRTCKVLSQEL